MMKCPKCGSSEWCKAGIAWGKQRYQCKQCPCKYTRSTPKGKGPAVQKVAYQLYLSGISMNRIGKLLGVSTVSILNWIRKFGEASQEKAKPEVGSATVVELDELCTFLGEKNVKFGYGLLFVEKQGESWTGRWVVEELEH